MMELSKAMGSQQDELYKLLSHIIKIVNDYHHMCLLIKRFFYIFQVGLLQKFCGLLFAKDCPGQTYL